jgi:CheY-like chemotaxis protein
MKATILLIEDNERNRYLTTFLLQKYDYKVVEAVDGKSGIEMACQIKPDLILLDIQLPVMDGYEVARELKKTSEVHQIPIVAVTSYAMVGDKEKILDAGCVGYIEKPIAPETFVSEIEQYLEPHKVESEKKRPT